MNRRRLLKLLGATGALAGAGVGGRYLLLPPSPSRTLDSAENLARRLFDALDGQARKLACVAYDHPLRQYHNRGVWGGGVNGWSLTWEQRGLLTDLLHAGVSEAGRRRVPEEFYCTWPGVHVMNVLFCGSPAAPPYTVVLTGPHLNLRIGGPSREGAAFGGPLVYGDQRGDERQGLPGNLYRYQFELGHRLFDSLRPDEKERAVQSASPVQTQIAVQGSEGSFAGVPIAALSAESRRIARELLAGILSTYPEQDVAHAWQCLEQNGGVEGLWLSYYEEGNVGGSGQYQIFRLEGPAAVFYFRGYPHVHAFINVTMDGDAPLSAGELLGENPAVLEGDGVKALFEEALRDQTGSDFAYYDRDSVAGRLRKGPIKSGDIYALESWQDHVVVVEIQGSNLAPPFVEALRARGVDPDPRRTYTVATAGHVAAELPEKLGEIDARRSGVAVRDAVIAHLKRRT